MWSPPGWGAPRGPGGASARPWPTRHSGGPVPLADGQSVHRRQRGARTGPSGARRRRGCRRPDLVDWLSPVEVLWTAVLTGVALLLVEIVAGAGRGFEESRVALIAPALFDPVTVAATEVTIPTPAVGTSSGPGSTHPQHPSPGRPHPWAQRGAAGPTPDRAMWAGVQPGQPLVVSASSASPSRSARRSFRRASRSSDRAHWMPRTSATTSVGISPKAHAIAPAVSCPPAGR